MKRNLVICSLVLVILFLSSSVFAGDTYTIQVSCSIPAVPGVNAPMQAVDEGIVEKQGVGENIQLDNPQDKERELLLTQVINFEDKIYYTTYSR